MGVAYSGSSSNATDTMQMMSILQNKRSEFEAKIESKRGNPSTIEVQGGRSVMRQSEIRVKTANGATNDKSSTDALCRVLQDFFTAVSGVNVKQASINGAQKVLSSGLAELFGVPEGQGSEKEGFIVIFCNYAFVRVDFLAYVFCNKRATAGWADATSEYGACYVADLAVLDPAELTASEMDFFLAQALCATPEETKAATAKSTADAAAAAAAGPAGAAPAEGDAAAPNDQKEKQRKIQNDITLIGQMKILLVQSSLLSRMLARPDIKFEQVQEVTKAMTQTMDQVKAAYDQLDPVTKKA
jgi:hypothetical protein